MVCTHEWDLPTDKIHFKMTWWRVWHFPEQSQMPKCRWLILGYNCNYSGPPTLYHYICYMHLPRGGCLSVNLPVCRSGWFGIGKSSLLFSQPSLRMSWTVTSTAYFIWQTDTLFLFQIFVTRPHHNCSVYWCVFTCLGSVVKHPPAVEDTQVWSFFFF